MDLNNKYSKSGITATDEKIFSSPAVSNRGTIYVATIANKILAIDPYGKLLWVYDSKNNQKMLGFHSSFLAVDDIGNVFARVNSQYGKLHAVSAAGSTLWSFPLQISSSPILAGDGFLYALTHDGQLVSIGETDEERMQRLMHERTTHRIGGKQDMNSDFSREEQSEGKHGHRTSAKFTEEELLTEDAPSEGLKSGTASVDSDLVDRMVTAEAVGETVGVRSGRDIADKVSL